MAYWCILCIGYVKCTNAIICIGQISLLKGIWPSARPPPHHRDCELNLSFPHDGGEVDAELCFLDGDGRKAGLLKISGMPCMLPPVGV